MYEQVEKPKENKSRAVANSVTQKKSNVKQGFGFVDNRPKCVAPENNNLEVRKVSSDVTHTVIQLMSIDNLVDAVKNGEKDKFKAGFRGRAPGMDEAISCQVTYEKVKKLLDAGNKSEALLLMKISDETRLKTGTVSHNVVAPDGSTHEMYHPTAQGDNMHGGPTNDKGNRQWVNHTSEDHKRAKRVRDEVDVLDMRTAAVSYTTRRLAQAPLAKNAVKAATTPAAKKRLLEANEEREKFKAMDPNYDSTKTQLYNAEWFPSDDGGVSPRRITPNDYD